MNSGKESAQEDRETSITDAIQKLLDTQEKLKDLEEENEKLGKELAEAKTIGVRAVLEGLLDTTYVQLSPTEQYRILHEFRRHGVTTDKSLDKALSE